MTLRISLRDGEKMIVNGAVMRASGRVELMIENHVALLRGREVMQVEEANTPARRLYFTCMMAYIDESGRSDHQQGVVGLLGDLMGVFRTDEARMACLEFARLAALGDYYRALGVCRQLMTYEAAAFDRLAGEAA